MKKLTNENITAAVERAKSFLTGYDSPKKSILSAALKIEDLLLFYQECLSEEAEFGISCSMREMRPVITLSVLGEKEDPRNEENNEKHVILSNLSKSGDEGFSYSYENGENTCTLVFERKRSFRSNFDFAWNYVKKDRTSFFAGVGTQLLSTVLSIVLPVVSANVIAAITESAFSQVILMALVLMATRIVYSLVIKLCGIYYNKVYCTVMTGLESEIAESVMDVETASIEQNGTGLFIERMTNDTDIIATGLSTLADMSTEILRHAGTLVAMLMLNRWAFLFMLAWLVVIGLIEKKRARLLEANVRDMRAAEEKVSNLVTEMVRGESDIKLLSLRDTLGEELKRRVEDSNGKLLKTEISSKKYGIVISEITNVFYFLFIALLVFLMGRNYITAVTALILFNYSEQLGLTTIDAVDELVDFFKRFSLSCERIMSVINGPRFPKEKYGTKHIDRIKGDIEFRDVSFAYDFEDIGQSTHNVLRNMSFSIKAGEKVAFVGKSGCGKSTVFGLISKLRNANSGQVLIDGTDIGELDRETIRNGIAVVSQSPYMFNMSIRDNLRIVSPGITDEEMREVMKAACIDDEVMQMTNGYDSVLGESGVAVSGGQKQRIAIARALLRKAPVILLDEATSALDNQTQQKVQQAIDNLGGEHTILIVAHRLSTVKNADRIFYLEGGGISAVGTHDELMESCGGYREMASIEYK